MPMITPIVFLREIGSAKNAADSSNTQIGPKAVRSEEITGDINCSPLKNVNWVIASPSMPAPARTGSSRNGTFSLGVKKLIAQNITTPNAILVIAKPREVIQDDAKSDFVMLMLIPKIMLGTIAAMCALNKLPCIKQVP